MNFYPTYLLSGFLFEKFEEVSKVNNIELENGKYKVIDELGKESPRFYALRDGEEWRDLTGDKLVYSMFCEIIRLKEKLLELSPKFYEKNMEIIRASNSVIGLCNKLLELDYKDVDSYKKEFHRQIQQRHEEDLAKLP